MLREYDVVVAGGGVSGVRAALAAAKLGAHTLLTEKTYHLGGRLAALRMYGFRGTEEVDGFPFEETDPIERVRAWREELEQAGVSVLTDASVLSAQVEDGTIKSLTIMTCEGTAAISGRVFVDATGTGEVAAACGVPFVPAEHAAREELFPSAVFICEPAEKFLPDEDLPQGMEESLGDPVRIRTERLPEGLLRVELSLDPGDLRVSDAKDRSLMRERLADAVLDAEKRFADAGYRIAAPRFPEVCFPEMRYRVESDEPDAASLRRETENTVLVLKKDGVKYTLAYELMLSDRVKNLVMTGHSLCGCSRELSGLGSAGVSASLGEIAGTAAALVLGCRDDLRELSPMVIRNVRSHLFRAVEEEAGEELRESFEGGGMPMLPVDPVLELSLEGLLGDDPMPEAEEMPAFPEKPGLSPDSDAFGDEEGVVVVRDASWEDEGAEGTEEDDFSGETDVPEISWLAGSKNNGLFFRRGGKN